MTMYVTPEDIKENEAERDIIDELSDLREEDIDGGMIYAGDGVWL
jgi:hypothetical protein